MSDATNDGPGVQLNLNVRGLPESATVAINERSNRLIREGRKVYKLGLGQSPFPVPEPVVASLRAHAGEKDYLPVRGLPALREAIAEHHRAELSPDRSPEDVLVGPGSKELMFLLQLVYYGDLVIPSPTWVSYRPQAQIVGRHVRLLNTARDDQWKLRADQLEQLCRQDPGRPRIVILTYPSNPTGLSYTRDELMALAQVARRYRVILLSDEIYGKLYHRSVHQSIVPFYPEGTIFSGGLSKWCGAGGWRLGVFVFPPGLRWLQDAMAAVASETFTSTSAPIQHAAVAAFRGGPEIEDYLHHSRRILAALGRELSRRLREAGTFVYDPDGAFYVFPDLGPFRERLLERGIETGLQLCERLLDECGVAVLPGHHFGRPDDELTIRVSFVNFDGARALKASHDTPNSGPLDEAFLREHCGPAVEAVGVLCDWLQA
jgi:aspartate aminotransferase